MILANKYLVVKSTKNYLENKILVIPYRTSKNVEEDNYDNEIYKPNFENNLVQWFSTRMPAKSSGVLTTEVYLK